MPGESERRVSREVDARKRVGVWANALTEEAQPIQGTADPALPVRRCRPLRGPRKRVGVGLLLYLRDELGGQEGFERFGAAFAADP